MFIFFITYKISNRMFTLVIIGYLELFGQDVYQLRINLKYLFQLLFMFLYYIVRIIRNYFRRKSDNIFVDLKNIADTIGLWSGFESVMTGGCVTDLLNLNSYFDKSRLQSDKSIIEEEIPVKYIFELSKCVAVVFIGDLNEIDHRIIEKVSKQLDKLVRLYR
jgi:hypothetical protein